MWVFHVGRVSTQAKDTFVWTEGSRDRARVNSTLMSREGSFETADMLEVYLFINGVSTCKPLNV